MYTLGIPNRQYRRTTQLLGPALANPIAYDVIKQDDGFYLFSFPDIDEYDFRDIVILLKNNGVTTIGADDQLTEKKIMKLTDLLKEQGNPSENNVIDELQMLVDSWEKPTYKGGGIDHCERSHHYMEDVQDRIDALKNPLPNPGDEEENQSQDDISMGVDDAKDFSPMQEQKLRNLIRQTIRQ